MAIKIFSKNNCIQCKMTKRFLSDKAVAFEEINIDEQPEMAEWLKEQGYQSVPITIADTTTIVGFQPDQLKQLG